MKRLILTSMLTAAGLLAQSGTASTPAQTPDNTKPAAKVVSKKKHHHKKPATAPAVQSSAPAKK